MSGLRGTNPARSENLQAMRQRTGSRRGCATWLTGTPETPQTNIRMTRQKKDPEVPDEDDSLACGPLSR